MMIWKGIDMNTKEWLNLSAEEIGYIQSIYKAYKTSRKASIIKLINLKDGAIEKNTYKNSDVNVLIDSCIKKLSDMSDEDYLELINLEEE